MIFIRPLLIPTALILQGPIKVMIHKILIHQKEFYVVEAFCVMMLIVVGIELQEE
jgi:hypothetical protein